MLIGRRAWTQLRPQYNPQWQQRSIAQLQCHQVQLRSIHCSTILRSEKEERRSGQDDKSTDDMQQPKEGKPQHKLTAKEKDDIIMARMKARMSLEGDEPYEDGQPANSGLRGNVKRNMFRVI